jgi:hypothetical protein
VNDARHRILRILPYPLPDAHHVPASRIHKQTPLRLQFPPRGHLRPERRDNHQVLRLQLIDLLVLGLARDRHDPHPANLVIDLRVVNDLAQQENSPVRIRPPRGVGQVYRPLHPVTKTELLRQLDGHVPRRQNMPVRANPLDQLAAVVRQHLGLHRRHNVRTAQVHFLRGRWGFRCHARLTLPRPTRPSSPNRTPSRLCRHSVLDPAP